MIQLQPRIAFVVITMMVAFLASLFLIWEQDIFWQLRAGRELWESFSFPQVDDWSFTAVGKPWQNFQWLSTLLFQFVYVMASFSGLVVLRALTVAFVFGLLAIGIYRDRESTVWLGTTVLTLAFLAFQDRIQLRSDFVALSIFVAAMCLLPRFNAYKSKLIVAMGLCLLIVNIHPGGWPFFAVASLYWFREMKFSRILVVVGLMCVVLFIHPYAWNIFDYLFYHLKYNSITELPNPDHLSLIHAMTNREFHGGHRQVGLFSWLILTVFSFVQIWQMKSAQERRLTMLVQVILVAMSIGRLRAIPYQVAFDFLLALQGLSWSLSHLPRRLLLEKLVTFSSIILLSHQLLNYPPRWGIGVDTDVIPVAMGDALQALPETARIYTQPSYGQYLAWRFHHAKVSIDTREVMYAEFHKTAKRLFHDSVETREWLLKNQVDVVAIPVLRPAFTNGIGIRDLREEYYPKSHWKLLYFDSQYMVLVSRQFHPNASEFKFLEPTSHESWLHPQGDMNSELQRCMATTRPHVVCRVTSRALSGSWDFGDDEIDYLKSMLTLAQVSENKILEARIKDLLAIP